MFTEKELTWMKKVLSTKKKKTVKTSYYYKKKTEYNRNKRRKRVRKSLDNLRRNLVKYTPNELSQLRNKTNREQKGVRNVTGIYIIHNCKNDKFYIGKSISVLDRVYDHFVKNAGNKGIYQDYCLGYEFNISIIPLEDTKYSNLNELEDNAIRAYNSLIPYGYNRNPGNVIDKAFFDNKKYQKVSDLILNRVKDKEEFSTLTNNKKRMRFIERLFKEFDLPLNINFQVAFIQAIKEFQRSNKQK
ncbi:GIY-YIG nuclease family protein [Virgibacillus halodenitrificans]|uniref:GIY-YIG nuclease family protein n=1 Tax=Virgibacillus halodenitrificans TaxID=1482 RepID=A0ABR7VSE5_VIRHA|nr:GIY-YIG nuclease family protein [Virgibacillus halodenitrificans]MBD1224806.1 GIY-YIG nuclease family protein [Virgibacillus halodenitrificans]